jgi:hypothetical protein
MGRSMPSDSVVSVEAMTQPASEPELAALVRAILDQRQHCFIPYDKPGLHEWDERATAALAAPVQPVSELIVGWISYGGKFTPNPDHQWRGPMTTDWKIPLMVAPEAVARPASEPLPADVEAMCKELDNGIGEYDVQQRAIAMIRTLWANQK